MSKLSKEVCKRCINEYAKQSKFGVFDDLKWNNFDELLWEQHKAISCYMKGWVELTINAIPEGCCYKLEQTVLSEKLQ